MPWVTGIPPLGSFRSGVSAHGFRRGGFGRDRFNSLIGSSWGWGFDPFYDGNYGYYDGTPDYMQQPPVTVVVMPPM